MPDNRDPMEIVLQIINSDEPDYEPARSLGPEVIPPLLTLIQGKDLLLTRKAVAVAARIQSEKRVDLLTLAATRVEPEVRVAVASNLPNVADAPIDDLLNKLLDDQDAGVRKFAIAAFAATRTESAKEKVQSIANSDPELFLRELAQYALRGEDPPVEVYLTTTDSTPKQ